MVLDYVANHVHEDHPLMDIHPDWTTDLYLPDGTMNTEKWDEHRLTTWFDTFMPTLDLERDEVSEVMSDSAAWWAYHSGIDGFRTTRPSTSPNRSGENSPKVERSPTANRDPDVPDWRDVRQSRSHRKLPLFRHDDAQFDFNLYDKMVGAIAFEDGNWRRLVQPTAKVSRPTVHTTSWATSPATKTGRASSLADGSLDPQEDTKFQGWTQDIEHNGDKGYAKMRLLMSYLMSVPGIPCVLRRRDCRRGRQRPRQPQDDAFRRFERARAAHAGMDLDLGQTPLQPHGHVVRHTILLSPQVLLVTRTYLDQQVHVALNRSGAHSLWTSRRSHLKMAKKPLSSCTLQGKNPPPRLTIRRSGI